MITALLFLIFIWVVSIWYDLSDILKELKSINTKLKDFEK